MAEFLQRQKPYQLTRPQNHIINKPILATAPNERYGVDCISMTSDTNGNGGGRGYKFILTVVDYYSRKVWLRRVKTQTAINVRNALINIVQETNSYPRIIQADNGREFQGETLAWFNQHNIQYVYKNVVV
jgi:IS30 family transposase